LSNEGYALGEIKEVKAFTEMTSSVGRGLGERSSNKWYFRIKGKGRVGNIMPRYQTEKSRQQPLLIRMQEQDRLLRIMDVDYKEGFIKLDDFAYQPPVAKFTYGTEHVPLAKYLIKAFSLNIYRKEERLGRLMDLLKSGRISDFEHNFMADYYSTELRIQRKRDVFVVGDETEASLRREFVNDPVKFAKRVLKNDRMPKDFRPPAMVIFDEAESNFDSESIAAQNNPAIELTPDNTSEKETNKTAIIDSEEFVIDID